MFAKRCLLVVMALTLFILLVPACGGGGEEATPTATTTSIATPTATSMTTTTPSPSGPVKIGAIQPWSGPAAMAGLYFADPAIKLVEKQVTDAGGILGGRSVKVVRADNRNTTADSVSGAKKLILEDKVSALVFGGTGSAQCAAVSDTAAESNVLFVSNAPLSDLSQRKNTLEATLPTRCVVEDIVKLLTEVLKPKTVAILASGGLDFIHNAAIPGWKKGIEAAGIKIVYTETPPEGVQDFSPYLTKIKYLDPDVLIVIQGSEESMTITKQITELGGWGHTQVVAMANSLAAAKSPGAKGWLILTFWHPGLNTPASVKFKEDFQAVNGKLPEANHIYYYFGLWAAIHAIELAGTAEDTAAIIQAARSGNLEFDTPVGHAQYNTEGDSGLSGMFIQIQEGGSTIPFNQ